MGWIDGVASGGMGQDKTGASVLGK